jgi:hypothetical protein
MQRHFRHHPPGGPGLFQAAFAQPEARQPTVDDLFVMSVAVRTSHTVVSGDIAMPRSIKGFDLQRASTRSCMFKADDCWLLPASRMAQEFAST